jgi:hypothetical protein
MLYAASVHKMLDAHSIDSNFCAQQMKSTGRQLESMTVMLCPNRY